VDFVLLPQVGKARFMSTCSTMYRVELGPWKGNGRSSTQILASGEID